MIEQRLYAPKNAVIFALYLTFVFCVAFFGLLLSATNIMGFDFGFCLFYSFCASAMLFPFSFIYLIKEARSIK